MAKYPKGAAKVRCGDWWERRSQGKRYVNSRGQCSRWTWHPSGCCSAHRYPWRENRNSNAKKEPTP